jgi:Zn-dependent protease
MPSPHQGSLRIFRFSGVDVYIHWSWLLLGFFEVRDRAQEYTNAFWGLAEWLAFFSIVLMHEFGHVFACRSVGGKADHVVLWPLGGVAYVAPPPRPGALLWSIAGGPLVNVLLVPITIGAYFLGQHAGPDKDLNTFTSMILFSNVVLLVFNLLPIYPLDGGQMLQALLWFVIGRARSLLVVSVLGFAGALGVIALAIAWASPWIGILAFFVLMRAINGFKYARALARLSRLPRHQGLACPSCGAAPLQRPQVLCPQCGKPFDAFETGGACPHCGEELSVSSPLPCFDCGAKHPMGDWFGAPTPLQDKDTAEPH